MIDLKLLEKSGYIEDVFYQGGENFTIVVGKDNFEKRPQIENFIKQIFAKSYSAKIDVTYPILLAVFDKFGEVVAALGLRSAKNEKLFLENYLEQNLTEYFSDFNNGEVFRSSIAEVGNLAAKNFSALKYLIKFCTNFLAESGFGYICLTGIKSLCNYFSFLGLSPKVIAKADAAKIKDSHLWGSYYESNPQVIIGDISKVREKISRNMDLSLVIGKKIRYANE